MITVRLLLGFIIIIIVSFVSCKNDDSKQSKPFFPSMEFDIKKPELPVLEKEALLGSPDAAFKLFQYYNFTVSENEKTMYWLTIAAENGNSVGQHNLAYKMYMKNENPNNKLRAIYWAKKSISNGNQKARLLLAEIEGVK
ncbi:MAG TPA: hypothetical protein PLG31_18460 [Spirochaetota bacterium]|mgnify:CR=1 FL=1|nr:hypothetical protein [Spirochaetota bacterium]